MEWGVKIERRTPVTEQIRELVRERIASGELQPGDRLPSFRELAQTLGVPAPTVNLALKPLVKQGVIERRHGHGTFVAERRKSKGLRRVALYYWSDIWGIREGQFLREVNRHVEDELRRRDISFRTWIDSRDAEIQNRGEPWKDLLAAAGRREFDALICPSVDATRWSWIGKLPVPVSCSSAGAMAPRVYFNLPRMADSALGDLRRQGCGSVGAILPFVRNTPPYPGQKRHTFTVLIDHFLSRAAELGMEARTEWVVTPPELHHLRGTTHMAYGREAFLRFWSMADRPEGLFVYPDTTVQGVIHGIVESRIDVPKDLRVVFHRNAGVELYCPFAASWVVSDEREVATALVELVERQAKGINPEPVRIDFRLESVLASKAGRETAASSGEGT